MNNKNTAMQNIAVFRVDNNVVEKKNLVSFIQLGQFYYNQIGDWCKIILGTL